MPLPPRYNAKFSFALPFALSAAATVNVFGAEQIFNLNSLFNPDRTGSNHQPYGFDQLVPTLYGRFLVKRVQAEIVVTTDAATKTMCVAWSVQPANATFATNGKNVSDVAEKSMDSIIFLDATGTSRRKGFALDIHTIEGITRAQYDAELDDYSGTGSADPSKTPLLRMAAANLQDATAATLQCFVLLTFEAELYERTILAQS